MRPLRKARRVNSPGPARPRAVFQHRVQHQFGRQQAAVAGDFHHVLAGEGARGAHHGKQHFIHHPPLSNYFAVMQRVGWRDRGREGGFAHGPETGVGDDERARPGKTDDGNPALAQRRGDGGDGVMEVKVQILPA